MKKYFCLSLVIAAFTGLIMRCSTSPVAGNGSQTPNSTIAAMVYNPGGSPAVHAKVSFYPVSYNPHTGSAKIRAVTDSTVTDANGNYSVKLDSGTYNVLAVGDSGVAYQDSIKVFKDSTIHPPADTLKAPGSLHGVIRLQPGDDARNVYILAMGTNTFVSPQDSAGNFVITNMAEGNYSVRILSILANYGVLDTVFEIKAGGNDTLSDTIILPFTGIQAPVGLSADYDDIHGVVILKWNKVLNPNLEGYLIYRNDASATIPQLISGTGAIIDTFYYDTVFTNILDTTNHAYIYRLKTQDKNANFSMQYSMPVSVDAVSPVTVKTFITFRTLSIRYDTATVLDTGAFLS